MKQNPIAGIIEDLQRFFNQRVFESAIRLTEAFGLVAQKKDKPDLNTCDIRDLKVEAITQLIANGRKSVFEKKFDHPEFTPDVIAQQCQSIMRMSSAEELRDFIKEYSNIPENPSMTKLRFDVDRDLERGEFVTSNLMLINPIIFRYTQNYNYMRHHYGPVETANHN